MVAFAGVAGIGLMASSAAWAQQSGLFGGNSPLNGSNGLGTASTGGLGGFGSVGNSGFGNTGGGFGNTGGGLGNTGGFGSTGGGFGNAGGGFGNSGGFGTTGGNAGFGGNNQFGAGNAGGQQGFIGRSNTQGAMIGNRQAGQQGQGGRNQFGNQGQFGRNNQNQFNRGGQNRNFMQQQQGMLDGGQGMQGQQQQRSIRPQLKVAFDVGVPDLQATSRRGADVQARFERISRRAALEGVTISVDGSTVTLRGQVASEDARKLAGMLVALEPGVRSVKNELTVGAEPPAAGIN